MPSPSSVRPPPCRRRSRPRRSLLGAGAPHPRAQPLQYREVRILTCNLDGRVAQQKPDRPRHARLSCPDTCCSRRAKATAERGSARTDRPRRSGSPRGPGRAGRDRDPVGAEILAGVKHQFVLAAAQRVALQQRRSAAAIGIGLAHGERFAAPVSLNSSTRTPAAGAPRSSRTCVVSLPMSCSIDTELRWRPNCAHIATHIAT